MSTDYTKVNARFLGELDTMLAMNNILLNSGFGQNVNFDDNKKTFTKASTGKKYFLGYPFEQDVETNGIFLYKVAHVYDEKNEMYPFFGDMQFARMYIHSEIFEDEKAGKALKTLFIFHLILHNARRTESGFYIIVGGKKYTGSIRALTTAFYFKDDFTARFESWKGKV